MSQFTLKQLLLTVTCLVLTFAALAFAGKLLGLKADGPVGVALAVLSVQITAAWLAHRLSASVERARLRRSLVVSTWSLAGGAILGATLLVLSAVDLKLHPPTPLSDPFGGTALVMALATIAAWAFGLAMGAIVGIFRTRP